MTEFVGHRDVCYGLLLQLVIALHLSVLTAAGIHRKKLVFVTYVYRVTHSSKLVKSAVQVIRHGLFGEAVTSNSCWSTESTHHPYCMFKCGKKSRVWALQQLANDAFRINLMPQVNCYKDNRMQRVSHLLPHQTRQLYRFGRDIPWQQRCSIEW